MTKILIERQWSLRWWLLPIFVIVGSGLLLSLNILASPTAAVGGNDRGNSDLLQAEEEIRRTRTEQEVLRRRQEILRYQLQLLERERDEWGFSNVPERETQWRDRKAELMLLLRNEQEGQRRMTEAFREIWDSQQRALAWSSRYHEEDSLVHLSLSWPVDSIRDISSGFLDTEYEQRFGIPHHGIDIPVLQRTIVRAAARGVVRDIADRGMGFNAMTLIHDKGVATLYGHVSKFLVQEGQHVQEGDPIALSGGQPGTPGAGLFSTGQHLHFEVLLEGAHLDPLSFLRDR